LNSKIKPDNLFPFQWVSISDLCFKYALLETLALTKHIIKNFYLGDPQEVSFNCRRQLGVEKNHWWVNLIVKIGESEALFI